MMTRDQLAELLQKVSVDDLAREAGISTKTIYRLRHKAHAPTLDTVEQIVAALERMKAAPTSQEAA